ncbi:hypothetical protein FLL45_04255 [Aliikangiella marina]|uniref:Transglutaminase-like domain-containing protein n=1 Tax=Aliikangiella marina TaxID=1712262 RepID=A0A545TIY7_9GAMM|nr:sugar-transfer associated ATP-grasp domain-containing protein [Aliikangiella marina]TQV77167.1 hypothetical protein FLL45_04255 [Aliikangiella marina]
MKLFGKILLNHINLILVISFVVVFAWHLSKVDNFSEQLKPQSVYALSLEMSFESDGDAVNIEAYVPQDNERQQLIEESVVTNGLDFQVATDTTGKIGNWSGEGIDIGSVSQVQYNALIATREVNYLIDDQLRIPKKYPESLSSYLAETDAIQVNHPEIETLWQLIKPQDTRRVAPVVKAIYDYTYNEIEGAPFKGFTDALTAHRLKQASCNGKSRLFVALARLNNIPARLVGGIILNQGSKKTSHQWLELYINGHWVPFGPTNGHFATLPENYLQLYRTDQYLFRHTADINFDYLFSIDKRLVASSHFQIDINPQQTTSEINVTQLLLVMGLEPETVGLFLLFPLCTLMITFLRNIIGIKTFGIFMPMLVAAACVFTGFIKGITAFIVILLFSYFSHLLLDKKRLLKIPRLAAIITLNTVFFIVGLSIIGITNRLEFGMLSLFPVVIISFIAEKIHNLSSDDNWFELFKVSVGTLLSIWLCYSILNSFLLEGVFAFYPEFYLLVLAALIYIGQWTGLRLTELHRFKEILPDKDNPVMGINVRNRDLVYRLNEKSLLRLAADKLQSKQVLIAHDVPVPDTILAVDSLAKIDQVDVALAKVDSFALKPNQGSQGNGILVIVNSKIDEQGNKVFISAGGKQYSMQAIKDHCCDIIGGTYSQLGDSDTAYFEPLLIQHQALQKLAPYGLSDIRVIVSLDNQADDKAEHNIENNAEYDADDLANGHADQHTSASGQLAENSHQEQNFHQQKNSHQQNDRPKLKVVSAMLRMPTKASDGKANLHQGAVGVSINIASGITETARIKKDNVTHHPDNQELLVGVQIPFWSQIIEMSLKCPQAIKLGYMGVDICIDEKLGPLVLEVNGRPGIEIQNVQQKGFYHEFQPV